MKRGSRRPRTSHTVCVFLDWILCSLCSGSKLGLALKKQSTQANPAQFSLDAMGPSSLPIPDAGSLGMLLREAAPQL